MNYIHTVEYHLAFRRDKRWARWLSGYKCLCASLWAWVPSLEPTSRWEARTSSTQLSPMDTYTQWCTWAPLTIIILKIEKQNGRESGVVMHSPDLITALGKLRHKVHEFEASTSHIVNQTPPKTVCQGLLQKSKGCMYEILWDVRTESHNSVLTGFVPTWHQPESSERKESPLRKCLHETVTKVGGPSPYWVLSSLGCWS